MEPGASGRRILRRFGLRGVGRPDRVRPGQRPGRLDPQPRRLLRRVRTSPVVRDHLDPGPPAGTARIAGRDGSWHGRTACPDASDLELALDVLAGPEPARAVGWRLALPPARGSQLLDYRIAAWLDDDYCSIDADVRRVLGAAVDAIATTGGRVDATARPCTLREAERLAQQLIQPVFAGFYPQAEYKRLQELGRVW